MTARIIREGQTFRANRTPPARSGPQRARPDQARHTPRITTPSSHHATSKDRSGSASSCLYNGPPQQQRTIAVVRLGACGSWKRGECYLLRH
jgi:hypothetical protein